MVSLYDNKLGYPCRRNVEQGDIFTSKPLLGLDKMISLLIHSGVAAVHTFSSDKKICMPQWANLLSSILSQAPIQD